MTFNQGDIVRFKTDYEHQYYKKNWGFADTDKFIVNFVTGRFVYLKSDTKTKNSALGVGYKYFDDGVYPSRLELAPKFKVGDYVGGYGNYDTDTKKKSGYQEGIISEVCEDGKNGYSRGITTFEDGRCVWTATLEEKVNPNPVPEKEETNMKYTIYSEKYTEYDSLEFYESKDSALENAKELAHDDPGVKYFVAELKNIIEVVHPEDPETTVKYL